jgi:hypothetical protein
MCNLDGKTVAPLSSLVSLENLNLQVTWEKAAEFSNSNKEQWNSIQSCDFVSSLVNLKRLNLMGNNLQIVLCLDKLENLEVLHLAQNRIKRLGICLEFVFLFCLWFVFCC